MTAPVTYTAPLPTKYCHACGSVIDAAAVVCPHCGVAQPASALTRASGGPLVAGETSDKRILVGFLLGVILPLTGAHRFYAGKIGTGLLQLFTAGGLGIWWLVDMVMLATGAFRDSEGNRMTEWT